MKQSNTSSRKSLKPRAFRMAGASALSCSVILGLASVSGVPAAFAAEAKVDMGTSSGYSVLAGQSVNNTGNSILAQDLGVNPGTSITGFPPGIVLGTTHATDAQSSLAQNDLVTAYDDTARRAPTATVEGDLAGKTLVSGVYKANESLELSGTVTLDGQGDPNSVWIFQVGSSLTTASASRVALVNGAQACNVYWQVGSSATIGTASDFKGSILALTSITVTNEANIEGRALARNGSVTLDDNTFTTPGCETSLPGDGETPPGDGGGDDETPPVVTPPGETPPGETPPVTPPGETPPGETPPGETPPGETPPGETPPGETPPVTPPGETPPGETPPGETPPGETPPGETPPGETPPGETPPGETPPGETPPVGLGNPPGDSSTGELAKTGSTANGMVAFGGGLMALLGAGFIMASRKFKVAG